MTSQGNTLNIAVICGGDSGEYEISIQSGKMVAQTLDRTKYTPYLIVVKGNTWIYTDSDGSEIQLCRTDFSLPLPGSTVRFDAVFNAIHGTPGEDGKLLAYLEILDMPFTGSSSAVAAATFNKYLCKQIVSSTGIALSNEILIRSEQAINEQAIIDSLGLPVFVKPNSNGSSVGVSKVTHKNELLQAIRKAFKEDEEVLVEAAIDGREFGCSVFEFQGRMMVFPVTEIITIKEFFDYEAKYTAGLTDEITPAQIDEEMDTEIKATAAMLYRHIGCRGFVRFDFILAADALYFLEVNTVPGMTQASILPQQAAVMGISMADLFGMAIEDALRFKKSGKG